MNIIDETIEMCVRSVVGILAVEVWDYCPHKGVLVPQTPLKVFRVPQEADPEGSLANPEAIEAYNYFMSNETEYTDVGVGLAGILWFESSTNSSAAEAAQRVFNLGGGPKAPAEGGDGSRRGSFAGLRGSLTRTKSSRRSSLTLLRAKSGVSSIFGGGEEYARETSKAPWVWRDVEFMAKNPLQVSSLNSTYLIRYLKFVPPE